MIPEQHPDPVPRYRFRPRSDRYDFPRFTGPIQLDVERYEPWEPRPFEWRELADPFVWLGGLFVFLAIVAFVFAVSIQDIR